MRRHALFVALVGCSSDNTAEETAPPPAPAVIPVGSGYGQCSPRKGTFSARYVVRDGTCGPNPERIAVVDQTAPPGDAGADGGAAACTGTGPTNSADNCEVSYSIKCPEDGIEKGGALQITGGSKWNVAGTYGTGVEEWTATGKAGNTLCRGTYSVTYRRQ